MLKISIHLMLIVMEGTIPLKASSCNSAFRNAKLYNNLPNEIKQTSEVKKFKAKVCNYFLNL